MRIPKKGPSVARMVKFLGLSKAQAQVLKNLMNAGFVTRTLNVADTMLNGHGHEELPSPSGRVIYVNMGDAYNMTLMFDWSKDKFTVGSWGDLVEAQPRRFA
jgi:predicted phosphodiesterase